MAIIKAVPFNPEKFIGPGWSISWQSQAILYIPQIDLSEVYLDSFVNPGEVAINLATRKGRQIIKSIDLDARYFLALWQNKRKIPNEWKKKTRGQTTCIYFTGTELLDPYGRKAVLCLCYRYGVWDYDWDWLNHEWVESEYSPLIDARL